MSGMIPGTVVPFRVRDLANRKSVQAMNAGAMRTYRVTAFYDYPPMDRTVVVEAEGAQRAMVKALLERRVPALFRKDEFGWLLPVFWHPRLAGGRRWPAVIGRNVIVWGEQGSKDKLVFGVDELEL